MEVKFTVPGEPVGKGRPRFARVGAHVKAFTPEKTVSYENLIKLEYQQQCRGASFDKDTQLDMRIMAYYTIPKSISKKKRKLMLEHKIRPMKKPDMDNVMKVVADSLNGIAYHDDVQVVDTALRKFYSENPRIVVTIRSVENE